MRNARIPVFLCVVLMLSMTGCATSFSAPAARAEIVRQTGEDPQKVFEVTVGRVTMALARHLLADPGSPDDALPLSGLTSFELAVYGLAPKGTTASRTIDFTAMPIRGWEPTLRFRDGARSGVVLVQASGDAVGDLVLLASDGEEAIYVRLRGTLSKNLPAALGKAVQSGGTNAVRHELQTLTDEK